MINSRRRPSDRYNLVSPEPLCAWGSELALPPSCVLTAPCVPMGDTPSGKVIMDGSAPSAIEVAPLQSQGSLYGFLLSGRWPADTVEWAKFLVLAVRMAAVPGLLPLSTVFRVREELPEEPQANAVGLVVAEGQLIGDHALTPGQFAHPQPAGLVVLHPPSSTMSNRPGSYELASGCLLLPGLPHLGLDHRAAWVEADVEGTVTQLVSRSGIDPAGDVDTAALALLLAA